jgi:HK97 family phage portal protein
MRLIPGSGFFGKGVPKNINVVDTKASRAAKLRDADTGTYSVYNAGMSDILEPYSETFEQQLNKYPNSIWLNVGVSRIVEAFSQVEFRIVDKRKEGEADNEVKGRIAQKLRTLIDQPNPWMNCNEFKEALALHLILTGNAYIEKVGKGQNIKELYVLNPKNMRVIPDKDNFIKGYVYTVDGLEVKYKPNEIVHMKYFDPRGESRYGLSRICAARMSIQADYDAIDWNTGYFRNAAWPSGIITCKDGINDEEFQRMKKELKQNYEGKSKVGKVMVLTGGLDWKQTSPNPKDLDFATLRRRNREEILALLGVPPTIAGIYEFENTSSRSAGIREQVVSFWSNTVMPIATKIMDKLNKDITEEFSPNFEIVLDTSGIPAMSDTDEMKRTRAETYKLLVRNGWPIQAALAEVYPKHKPFNGAETAFFEGIINVINPATGEVLETSGEETADSEDTEDQTDPETGDGEQGDQTTTEEPDNGDN